MQEDVEQRTIALSVRTACMTSIVLQQVLRRFLDSQKHKSKELPHGKQTLKDLMKQNTGVSSLEVNYDNTYCSNMAKTGLNPKTLQYLMGHADISVTLNTYTHIKFEDAREELVRSNLL